ncbi:3'-5' exonuclease [Stutzerimonas stutzeri]|uniref:3'-5' exonuclease n=1 Tax=Stutzerimonas stutzeri TaxID=316 RepID=W8RAY8_STUST|nr:3'-5' exonuclease [Stutzerimonas stutzeri]AHL75597.1 3'-5' exonuclease [Stutzerimonas stutzeri]MCQ4327826.1 3'-5' exonuclease domain-containing protein 2 [Stutzerimonas stutzeri]
MTIVHIAPCVDIDALPRFDGLALDRIVIPSTPEQFHQAADEINTFAEIGFDTESKPTFRVGELSTGPHLIQFATPEKTYLFQVEREGCIEAAKAVLESDRLLKVGFGLSSDRSRLRSKLGVELRRYLDLGTALRYPGKKGQVGLRGAVAAVLGAGIRKSRRVSTSNWASRSLSEAQQHYAANDAYAALRVFLALDGEARASLQERIVNSPHR